MAPRPICSLVVFVDIEKFSDRPDVVQGSLRTAMYECLHEAVDGAGIGWEDVVEDRGDGYFILLRDAGPVEILGAFVREMDAGLREYARSRTDEHALRIRMAVHHGYVWNDGRGWVGSAVNMAARLVNADVTRETLRSIPEARMVVIIGDELHRDVVKQGHRSIDSKAYFAARAVAKNVDVEAWLYVPGHTPTKKSPGKPDPGEQATQGDGSGAQESSGVVRVPAVSAATVGAVVGEAHVQGDFVGLRQDRGNAV